MRRTVEKIRQSRRGQSESGQAMIEFTLTISMTLLLIFGLIDLSRAIYTASVLQWSAQQGARVGIVEESNVEVAAAVHERMTGLSNCPVPSDCITVTRPSTNMVQVDVSYEFEFIAPIVTQIVGNSIVMTASASMIAY